MNIVNLPLSDTMTAKEFRINILGIDTSNILTAKEFIPKLDKLLVYSKQNHSKQNQSKQNQAKQNQAKQNQEAMYIYVVLMLNLSSIDLYTGFFSQVFIKFWYNYPNFAKYLIQFIIESNTSRCWEYLANIIYTASNTYCYNKTNYNIIFQTINRGICLQLKKDWSAFIKYKSNPDSKSQLSISMCTMYFITEFDTNNLEFFKYYDDIYKNTYPYLLCNNKSFVQCLVENNKDLIRDMAYDMVKMCKNNEILKSILQSNYPFIKWNHFKKWNSTSWDNIILNLEKHPSRFNNINMILKVVLGLLYMEIKTSSNSVESKNIVHNRFNTIEECCSLINFYQEWKNNSSDNNILTNMPSDTILQIICGDLNKPLMKLVCEHF